MSKKDVSTKVVHVIDFHGINLLVVNNQGIKYIYAKPLVDLAGLTWRRAKKTFFEPDNAILYGTKELNHPVLSFEGHNSVTPSMGVYIRFDRSRMYLTRIQTSRMRAKGKEEAAEKLLKLQIEWAEVIHDYETKGFAIKNARVATAQKKSANLITLMKAKQMASSTEQEKAIERLINESLGIHSAANDDQGDLFDKTQSESAA